MRIASDALPLAAIRLSPDHQAELRISGANSSIADLYVFRKEKDGICPTLACRVDTLLKSVGEVPQPRDRIGGVGGSTTSHEVLRIVRSRNEVPTVNTEFHKITYRYKIRETPLEQKII
jgi:hypothetical protein